MKFDYEKFDEEFRKAYGLGKRDKFLVVTVDKDKEQNQILVRVSIGNEHKTFLQQLPFWCTSGLEVDGDLKDAMTKRWIKKIATHIYEDFLTDMLSWVENLVEIKFVDSPDEVLADIEAIEAKKYSE